MSGCLLLSLSVINLSDFLFDGSDFSFQTAGLAGPVVEIRAAVYPAGLSLEDFIRFLQNLEGFIHRISFNDCSHWGKEMAAAFFPYHPYHFSHIGTYAFPIVGWEN